MHLLSSMLLHESIACSFFITIAFHFMDMPWFYVSFPLLKFLIVMNQVSIIIHLWILVWTFSLNSEAYIQSSKVLVPFSNPTSNKWEFLWLFMLINIWCCQVLHFRQSKECVVVVSHWGGVKLQFLNEKWCCAHFQMFICHFYAFCLSSSFAYFFTVF